MKKKYNDCKLIATDRRKRLQESESQLQSLRSRQSPDTDKENEANNTQLQRIVAENQELKKENASLNDRYKQYKQLYYIKTTRKQENGLSNLKETAVQTDCDIRKIAYECKLFERKYQRTRDFYNVLVEAFEKYRTKFVEITTIHRIACEKLSKYEPFCKPVPFSEIDPIYEETYHKMKNHIEKMEMAKELQHVENI